MGNGKPGVTGMLSELRIRNFAVITEQSIQFGAGLNVISGESGAGKSIILQALELVLGARASSHKIRSGAERLEVEAIFDIAQLAPEFLEELPELARMDGEQLVLTRTVDQRGKSRALVNGHLASAGILQGIGKGLLSICSQSSATRLLVPEYHLGLVDGFAGHAERLARYREGYDKWRKVARQLEQAARQADGVEQRRVELEGVVSELSALEPRRDLRVELEEQVATLSNAERLIRGSNGLTDGLSGLSDRLTDLQGELREMAAMDRTLESYRDLLDSAVIELGEVERGLERYASGLEIDEDTLESVRERLAELARCERKYRCDSAALEELLNASQVELESLEAARDQDRLASEEARLRGEVEELAGELTKARVKAGTELSRQIELELEDVNMRGVRFEVRCSEIGLGSSGHDAIEFFAATNPGDELRPIRQIASGGELARLTLVLKKVLRERAGVHVLVFDEVDSGMSGKAARAVGEKLHVIAQESQVVCITHLAQVASFADQHILVDKRVGSTVESIIKTLDDEERVDEIARMLAGYDVTTAARASARELLSSKPPVL